MTFLYRFTFALLLVLGTLLAQAQTVVQNAKITFTTIDVPGAGYTGVWGTNMAGDLVGSYAENDSASQHGFLYRNGTFTYFDYPGASSTFVFGINDSGVIVGAAEFQGGSTGTGFLYDGVTFTPISAPGQPVTYFWSINNAGDIVGSAGVSGGNFRGFLYRNGRFRTLNFPGNYSIGNPMSINNLRVVVGYTIDGSDKRSYKYRMEYLEA